MPGYRKILCYSGLMLSAMLLASMVAHGLAAYKLGAMSSKEPWRTVGFLNQNGDVFSFQDVGNKPTIVSFAFTGCSMYCSAQAIELKFLQEELNASIGPDAYQIISVSLTPVYDQPADMLRFANRFQIDFSNWQFLTGSEVGTESLIASTGISVTRYTGGTRPDLDHTTEVYLLNADGQVADRINGIPLDKEHLKTSLFNLLGVEPLASARATES